MSRSELAPACNSHVEEPFVYLHPGDMQRRKIVNDTLLKIKTKRGAIILPAMGDDSLKPGHAFLHMHWGSAYMAGDGINALATPVRAPISPQPDLKPSAARPAVFNHAPPATTWRRGR